ncbi:MAG: hypothetical protein DI586_09795 [Micavibrio aeruginosavorus]|uniref:Uncharacterized protein n=1 Tax=Micavibrio aeruginosavorus TaxID=349221 RepID=A0A2W5FGQ5_9BACT|nr:MAG: hypothetical protein DI586_09795 [Micavibrio aeruginosavorus]
MKKPSPFTCFKVAALGLAVQQIASCSLRNQLNPQADINVVSNCEIWANSGKRILISNHPEASDLKRIHKTIPAKDYKDVSRLCIDYISENQSSELYSLRLNFYELINGQVYKPLITGASTYRLDITGRMVISDARLGNKWKMSDAITDIKQHEAMLDGLESANRKGRRSSEERAAQDIASKSATYTVKAAMGGWK